jgi:aconitate hydratase
MGQSPKSAGISLRTFNRNFEGRSGTEDAQVYLVSPETAAVSAITGVMTDPTTFELKNEVVMPKRFTINDNLIDAPAASSDMVEVEQGPNIKPFPINEAMPETIAKKALLIVGDNITTDHIMPAGAKILPYRSNIPKLSEFCFVRCDEEFPSRARQWGGGIIIGGSNYGQGSSREHAALVPLYLGVKAVIAKSFARIHAANLINNGIIPITFADPDDYDRFELGDELELPNVRERIMNGEAIEIVNVTKNVTMNGVVTLSERQKQMLCAGGLLNYTKNR